jgi:hypothetical protein
VQRGDLDAQQRVLGSERHVCGSEFGLVVCRVWRERRVLVYADVRCVGWYAGGLGVVVDEVWSDGSRGSECYVSASIGRRL